MTCDHGTDPELCLTCKPAAAAATAQADPAIEAMWLRATHELAGRLRPWVQEHKAWEIARDFVRDLSAEGFRPPLRPPRPPLQQADPEKIQAVNARGVSAARQLLEELERKP